MSIEETNYTKGPYMSIADRVTKKPDPKNKHQSFGNWLGDVFVPFALKSNNNKYEKPVLLSKDWLTRYRPITNLYQSIFNFSEYRNTLKSSNSNKTIIHLYYVSLPVQILNFFAFPVKPDVNNPEKKLNPKNLLRNLFGLRPETAPNWQKAMAIVLSPLSLTWNLLQIVTKTVWNIATLFTEFLPALGALLCEKGLKKLFDGINDKNNSLGKKVGLGFLMGLLAIPFYVCKVWRILGRTITSPLTSMEIALMKGRKLPGVTGEIVGRVLQAMSLAITITAYTILFPLAAKAILTKAPAFISKVAEMAPKWLQTVVNNVLPAVKWLGNNVVMKAIGPVVKPALKLFGLGAENSILVTVGAGISFLAGTVGTYSKHLAQNIGHWWNNMIRSNEDKVVTLEKKSANAPENKQVDNDVANKKDNQPTEETSNVIKQAYDQVDQTKNRLEKINEVVTTSLNKFGKAIGDFGRRIFCCSSPSSNRSNDKQEDEQKQQQQRLGNN